jgi:ubiquinone/menaquinone biosynthesis C-methylase UbiE
MPLTSASAAPSHAHIQHAAVNHQLYSTPGVHRAYLSEVLEPSETASLLRFQPLFAGKSVLDIGVGAGRTTRYLAPLADRYEAIDYSPDMISYMKQAMPEINAQLGDFRDMNMFGSGTFDFVLATNNVLDNFSHQDRFKALREAHRVLRPGGMLVLSSHNLRYTKAFSDPEMEWSAHPIRLVRNMLTFISSYRNNLRVRGLRETHPDHALLNDCGHQYAIIHYYAAPETVVSQLRSTGFEISNIFDKQGHLVTEGFDTGGSSSLTYAAERLP